MTFKYFRKTSIIDVRLAYKSFLSRISMLINHTMWSSNFFFFFFFAVSRDFHSPSFSEPRFFRIQVFQGSGFLEYTFFRAQVFLSPGFSGSSFFRVQLFWVQVFLGPGFSRSGSRVWVQVLEAAVLFHMFNHWPRYKNNSFQLHLFPEKKILFCNLFKWPTRFGEEIMWGIRRNIYSKT